MFPTWTGEWGLDQTDMQQITCLKRVCNVANSPVSQKKELKQVTHVHHTSTRLRHNPNQTQLNRMWMSYHFEHWLLKIQICHRTSQAVLLLNIHF